MLCNVCNQESKYVFSSKILDKHDVKYYFCDNCSFLQIEKPYWLDEAYSPKILAMDTGIMWRNIELFKTFSVLLYFLFDKNKSFLDFGGGHGIFTRLMRDIGFDFYLYDPYAKNVAARGFEYKNDKSKKIELITSIECFEHLENISSEIENMLDISKNILFTTHLLPKPIPKPGAWSYYGPNHGQHISFYSLKTLKFIAQKYGLNLYTDEKFVHLLTPKKIKPKFFKYLIKFTHWGLWRLVSRKLKSKGVFYWIGQDSQKLEQTREK